MRHTSSSGLSRFGLDADLFDFEPALDPAGDPAGPAAPVGPAEPGFAPAPAAAPVAVPAGISHEEMQTFFYDSLEQILQQPPAPAAPEAPAALPPYDPYNPEVVRAYAAHEAQAAVGDQLKTMLAAELAPMQELLGTYAEERGRAVAHTELDKIAGEIGDFDREQAVQKAAWLLTQGVAPRDAIAQAARDTLAYETRMRQAGQDAYVASLTRMHDPSNAAPNPGGAATEVVPVPTGPNRYKEQLDRSLAQMGMRPGVAVPTG